jgi:hypothetical protein
MPTYEFKNTKTDEVEEKFMKIAELDNFKKANPHLKQQVSSNIKFIGGKDGSVLSKAGDGWKEVQQRIQSGMPPKDRGLINTK